MKICIDTRSLGQKGIFSYGKNLLHSLREIDSDNQYLVIVDSQQKSWGFPEIEEVVVPSLSPFVWIIWSNLILPKILDNRQIDIYHSLKHVTAYNVKQKRVLTFHGGPMLYKYPDLYTMHDRIYWKFSYNLAAKKYDRIITTTDAEKGFFAKKSGVAETKFNVVNLGFDERFHIIVDENIRERVKKKYKLPDNFILFVGRFHPIKNLERLVKAYASARHSFAKDHKLVFAGGRSGAYFEKIVGLVQELSIGEDVVFLDHISEDLPVLYNLAKAFLLPSHYENWGIVLLEAMACGLPVITSDIQDLNDVVGDSAIRVNPQEISEISNAMVELINSDNLQSSLIYKGLERVKMFSWNRCAKETLSIYKELMQE